ncbi:MAG TPA: alpha/beta hydrolase [Actinomycetes bacterium]|nr:alpha/beta hydrolase [Actinomycetes bacterium]
MRGAAAPRRRTLAAGVLALAALAVAACTSSGASPTPIPASPAAGSASATVAPSPDLARYYSQHLTWSDCGGGFDCTKLTVPLNYADPAAGDIQLAVIRLKASGHRIGSLLVNPGGPGASGVDFARAAQSQFTSPLREAFDIVGFDPRGVGGSAPVRCLSSSQLDAYFAADPTPDTAAEQQAYLKDQEAFAAGCERRSGKLLPYVATVDAARDMDVLRAALGDPQLYYLGSSYGTYLGATYAGLFPKRVGRMVLDGALDPTLSNEELILGQAKGFQVALDSFIANCDKRSDCPLPPGQQAGEQRITQLLSSLDAKPIPSGQAGRPLTEGLAVLGISEALYAPEYLDPLLRAGLQEAFAGNGSTLLRLADFYTERRADGSYPNLIEANVAINCADKGSDSSISDVQRVLPQFTQASPVFGPALAWADIACAGWPVPHQPIKAIHAPGAAPILVIGTTRDPATPYAWAQGLASQLDSGHLLTYDGDGHTAYNRGSSCINRAVEDYLVSGTLPAKGLVCH